MSKSHLPEGIIALVAQTPEFTMPGSEYLKTLSKIDLGLEVTHTNNEIVE